VRRQHPQHHRRRRRRRRCGGSGSGNLPIFINTTINNQSRHFSIEGAIIQ
jgi:hypothetical protein